MNSDVITIKRIFEEDGRDSWEIPYFQRGYDWEIKHVEDFWNDLIETPVDKMHFFGTIYTRKDETNPNRIQIIDGQQRLTTVAVFLICARNFYFSKKDDFEEAKNLYDRLQRMLYVRHPERREIDLNNFVLKLSRANRNFFREHLVTERNLTDTEKLKQFSENDSSDKLADVYLYFANKIVTDCSNDDGIEILWKWIDTIRNNFMINQINLDRDTDEYDMFDSINNRGKGLEPSDLTKNRLFSILDRELSPYADKEERIDDFDEKWNKLRNRVTGKTTGDYDFDTFLQNYLTAFHYSDAKLRKIFDYIKKLIEEEGFTSQKIIDEFYKWGEIFEKLRKPNSDIGNKNLINHLKIMRETENVIVYPLLLVGYQKFWENDKKSFEYLTELSLKFFIRNKSICQFRQAQIKNKINSIAKSLRVEPGFTVDDIFDEFNKFELAQYPTTDEKLNSLYSELKPSGNSVAKSLLELVEIHEDREKEIGYDVSLEHIMPKSMRKWQSYIKEKNNFGTTEEAKEFHTEYKDRLGNLTLLSGPINSEQQDESFDKKKQEAYSNPGYEITNWLSDIEVWNKEQIDIRHAKLIESLKKILNLNEVKQKFS